MSVQDIIDRRELFARVDDDVAFLKELIEIFLEEYPTMLLEIQEAVAAKDAQQLKSAAHALKGSVSNFCAKGAVEASRRLEHMGAVADFSEAEKDYQILVQEMENVKTALYHLMEDCTPWKS